MFPPLQRLLAREQGAFLARQRPEWAEHLSRVREFLQAGLERADPGKKTLILGAGSGLEVPWPRAPENTVGWDADPFSRVRTLLRHGRWVPWVFGDITGAFGALQSAAERSARESWSGRRRRVDAARLRLAALLPSLPTKPVQLRQWIQQHRPGTILAANFMGQLAPLAQRIIEGAFAPEDPWESDVDRRDPLAEALEAWTGRLVGDFLEALRSSGAELWMVHDRAVLDGDRPVQLGAFTAEWKTQLQGKGTFEAWDPLGGVNVLASLGNSPHLRQERWLWSLAPEQLHLVEALAFGPSVVPTQGRAS